MLSVAVVLFLLTLLEVFVLVQVSNALGVVITVLLIILLSAVGAWVLKHEGTSAWKRVIDDVQNGRMPTGSLIDGFLVALVGILLLTPGFVSAGVGLVLAIPAVRHLAGGRLVGMLSARVARHVRIVGQGIRDGQTFSYGEYRAYSRSGDGSGADDIIDLDAEEVILDDAFGELGPGGGT